MTGLGASAGVGNAAPPSPKTVSGWEEPRPAPSLDAPVLSVDGFEGPLDWLVEMARARKLDLARLSILSLVEAFGAALTEALGTDRVAHPAPDLARWADWLSLAADLVRLRSGLSLHPDAAPARAAQAEAAALRRALAGRADAAVAADWLDRRPQLGREVFARGRPAAGALAPARRAGEGAAPAPAVVGDITALLRACLVALRVPEGTGVWQPARAGLWRVADAVAHIGQQLDATPNGGVALETLLPRIGTAAPERELRCKAAVASTLLAGLELARDGRLVLDQPVPWTAIQVRHRKPDDYRSNDHGLDPRDQTAT